MTHLYFETALLNFAKLGIFSQTEIRFLSFFIMVCKQSCLRHHKTKLFSSHEWNLLLHYIERKRVSFEIIHKSATEGIAVEGAFEVTCVIAVRGIFFQCKLVAVQTAIDTHLGVAPLGVVVIGALDITATDLDVHGDGILGYGAYEMMVTFNRHHARLWCHTRLSFRLQLIDGVLPCLRLGDGVSDMLRLLLLLLKNLLLLVVLVDEIKNATSDDGCQQERQDGIQPFVAIATTSIGLTTKHHWFIRLEIVCLFIYRASAFRTFYSLV